MVATRHRAVFCWLPGFKGPLVLSTKSSLAVCCLRQKSNIRDSCMCSRANTSLMGFQRRPRDVAAAESEEVEARSLHPC